MSEAYQHTEYELRNDIDNINCISSTFERYVEEVNHFIDRLLENTKEINVLRSDIKEKDKEIRKLVNKLEEQERHIKEANFEIERLNNIINELGKYLEQRKEEWNNSRNKEDISSYHYIMLIKDLLEILKGSDNE